MKFVRVLKASDWEVLRRHHDTANGEDYYYIWGPDGEYCDADGEPYHFDTREDALEEVEYLKAEHKGDEKAKDIKSELMSRDELLKKIEKTKTDMLNNEKVKKGIELFLHKIETEINDAIRHSDNHVEMNYWPWYKILEKELKDYKGVMYDAMPVIVRESINKLNSLGYEASLENYPSNSAVLIIKW